eukprot:comp23972_c0_seq2/m.42510 comp23972_c0_seq2/g.42510  ORF comp23972_c0_seq2/g.42510 comp23972_c0_seq2/m.42510 type:complete len:459 (-) comp23972_c0_seq2:529-1905(-)
MVPVAVSKNNSNAEPSTNTATTVDFNQSPAAAVTGSQSSKAPTAPTSTAAPTPTIVKKQMALCDCKVGAYFNGSCYAQLADAITEMPDGGNITIPVTVTVTTEIPVTKSLTLLGATTCGVKGRPTINVDMNAPVGGALRLLKKDQVFTARNLKFQRVGKGFSTAIRTPELAHKENVVDTHETGQQVALTIDGCEFTNFYTQARGGSAIWVEKVKAMNVVNSMFISNIVETEGYLYDGTGAIWIRTVPVGVTATIQNCRFEKNKHLYFHGLGAGAGFFEVFGKVVMKGNKFYNNVCSAGGGFYIDAIQPKASVSIEDDFQFNQGVSAADEMRGGAMWLKDINGGTVYIGGDFANNVCPRDRAGAIANNRLEMGGRVTVNAVFEKNTCGKGGSVWDTLQGFRDSSITFAPGCQYSENSSPDGWAIRLRRPVTDQDGNPLPANEIRDDHIMTGPEAGVTFN